MERKVAKVGNDQSNYLLHVYVSINNTSNNYNSRCQLTSTFTNQSPTL